MNRIIESVEIDRENYDLSIIQDSKRLSSIKSDKILIVKNNDEVYENNLYKFDAIILLEPLNQTFDILGK